MEVGGRYNCKRTGEWSLEGMPRRGVESLNEKYVRMRGAVLCTHPKCRKVYGGIVERWRREARKLTPALSGKAPIGALRGIARRIVGRSGKSIG